MNTPKVRFFSIELAICLLVPLVFLIAIILLGYGYVVREKRAVMRQVALMDEVPLLEERLSAAQKSLSCFRMINGGKENGEWAHRISQAASFRGVVVKSVNTEKITPQVIVSCNDYRIHVSGEGRMAAVVRWVDEMDQPGRCFKLASLKMRPVKLGPVSGYELETVIQARSITMHSQPGEPLSGRMEPALVKLNELTLAVNELGKTKWQELDTHALDERDVRVNDNTVPITPAVPLALKLNGIVKAEHKPLALTDHGVLGEGDMIDGYRIIHVAADYVVVENGEGHQDVVQLYRTEVNP